MKKRLLQILTILIILGISIFIGLYIYVDDALTPDPDFNTLYQTNYTEEKFNLIKSGEKYQSVIGKLGKPISVDSIQMKDIYLYSNAPERIRLKEGNSNGVTMIGGFDSLYYILIEFKVDKVERVSKSYDYKEIEIDSLENLTRSQILNKLGKPDKEMNCSCECQVLNYSKLKEGPYKGKHPITNHRKIIMQNNSVKTKVAEEGNPHNPYVGMCEIRKN